MRRPTCTAAHRRASHSRSQGRSHSADAPANPASPAGDVEVDEDPVPFEGDFFRAASEYAANDLPFGGKPMDINLDSYEPAEESSDDEGSDDEAVGHDIAQPVPEQERDGRRLQSPPASPISEPSHQQILADVHEEDSDQNAVSGQQPQGSPPSGITLEQHKQVRDAPVHITAFGGKAGAPTQPGQGPHSAYTSYAREVDPDAKNPYAPFASRMDWEIARWAKLRGSGSTAFTDLLAIPEVCRLRPVFIVLSLTTRFRSETY